MHQRIEEVLSGILNQFRTGDIPEVIALASYPEFKVPCNSWSLTNRVLVWIGGTKDARGWRQWCEAGRIVKQGKKAIYILVPFARKVMDEDLGEERFVLQGFLPRPVFRVEDTEGQPLEYENLKLPPLPLIKRAREWGIEVKAVPGNPKYEGYYSPRKKLIALATKAEGVFFHELAHAADERINGRLEKGQEPFQEIIAELSATALCRLVGKDPGDSLGNSYRYIENYAGSLGLSPVKACLRVMGQTEKILKLILEGGEGCVQEAIIPQESRQI